MVKPSLPSLPDRGHELADNPVVAEPPVPPAEAAEPVEVNRAIPSVILVFCVTFRRSRPLGHIVDYLLTLVLFLCVSLPGSV